MTPGTLLTPTLRLLRTLGQGGMGTVWVAEHATLRTQVAVKIIDAEVASRDATARARFEREAAIAAQIKSPHSVQMLDHGVTAEGVPFIVMELLEGESLQERLARTGRIGLSEVGALLAQVAHALERAHALGIVHRDLKPANLFLVRAAQELFVKVLDFGIAKSDLGGDMRVKTATFAVIGTPQYMSPEQLISTKDVTFATDLWALAVVAYQALVGRVPYDGDTVPRLTLQVCSGQHRPIREIDPALPVGLDAWFARAFQQEPGARFPSAGTMAEAYRLAIATGALQPAHAAGAAAWGGGPAGVATHGSVQPASPAGMPAAATTGGVGHAATHGGWSQGPSSAALAATQQAPAAPAGGAGAGAVSAASPPPYQAASPGPASVSFGQAPAAAAPASPARPASSQLAGPAVPGGQAGGVAGTGLSQGGRAPFSPGQRRWGRGAALAVGVTALIGAGVAAAVVIGGAKGGGPSAASNVASGGSSAAAAPGASAAAGVDAGTKVVGIACERRVSYALMGDGTVRAWGLDDGGGLGIGKKGEDAATPVAVQGVVGAVEVDAGGDTGVTTQVACARLRDGAVKCWGSGEAPSPDTTEELVAAEVRPLRGAKQLSLSTGGTGCAVMADDSVECWGSGRYGLIGPSSSDERYAPTQVAGLSGVAEVSVGTNHACARLRDGSVRCWGHNGHGEVAPTRTDERSPTPGDPGIRGATLVHAAEATSCAAVGARLLCWGEMPGQQLATETPGVFQMSGVAEVIAMGIVKDRMCVLEASGVVKCLGDNRRGELGRGAPGGRFAEFAPVRDLRDAVALDVGEQHACAATKTGAAYCWGYNQRGELGDATLRDRAAPVEVRHATAPDLPPAARGLGDAQEASAAVDFGHLPPECSYQPRLALDVTSFGLQSLDVETAYASLTPTRLEVHLANFRQDDKELNAEPRGEQVHLTVTFFRDEGQAPIDLAAYAFDNAGSRVVNVFLRSARKATQLFGGPEGGSVQLRYLGPDWACGEIAVSTKGAVVRGPFAAKVLGR